MESNVQLTFSSEETVRMAQSASDFFSSQFTFGQMGSVSLRIWRAKRSTVRD